MHGQAQMIVKIITCFNLKSQFTFMYFSVLLCPSVRGNHFPLGHKPSGGLRSGESNVGHMTWNNDRRRRVTSTIATNLVTMDTVVDNEVIVVTHHCVVNVEIFE